MAAITPEQLKDVVVHLSAKEFEELVEARKRHGTDRLKPTPKPGNLINWPKKRCAIIAKGSASGFRETRFDVSQTHPQKTVIPLAIKIRL
jgi:hypothetical protein